MTSNRLPTSRLLMFSAPTFALAILITPVHAILPPIYAKYTAVTLPMIGTVFLLTRLFDAVSDPVIGYLSDVTRTKWGPRKPWICAGTVLALPAVYFLFTPETTAGFYYFLFWSLMLYLAWTMIDIPYQSWASELSRNYQERSRIFTLRSVFGIAGALAFMSMPILPIFDTKELTLEVFAVAALAIVFFLPTLMIPALYSFPANKSQAATVTSPFVFYKSAIRNKPFCIFVAAFLLSGFGSGMHSSALFFHFDSYLGLGDKAPYLLPVPILLSFLGMPIWLRLMNVIGRHRAWALGAFVNAIVFLGIATIQPGEGAFAALVIGLGCLGLSNGVQFVAPAAMLGDVIDYHRLKTGETRTANYFATFSLITKFNAAIGGAVGFFLLSVFGFDPKIGLSDSGSEVIGILSVYAFVPSLLFACAGVVALRFPIDERRQDIVRRRLESRAAAQSP